MEGNIMIRSISEPITLRKNIFIDTSKKRESLENGEEELIPAEHLEDPDEKLMDQEDA